MVFTINENLVFTDSIQFMNSSLDTLVKNLSDIDFKHLVQEFSSEFLKLVKQKGVYPHEYMDSFKKFFDDKLPDRYKFFSSLKDDCISEKDYLNAINACIMFKMKTMGDYYDLYLNTDVLLLAVVFENFIDICLEDYGLDLISLCSSPRFSWDAILNMAGIELELISYTDMCLFVEKGMGVGISYITKR